LKFTDLKQKHLLLLQKIIDRSLQNWLLHEKEQMFFEVMWCSLKAKVVKLCLCSGAEPKGCSKL